ncbi:MAG: TlpA disulfide reductase family protein [Gammaproteobacteria bacterium]|nr:TlpA disulfide reductase family protein [Gammaproteobacteria bacterium]
MLPLRTLLTGLLLAMCWPGPAPAAAAETIDLASGFGMHVHRYPAAGRRLLIWLPSKYGIRPGNFPFARSVQDAGIDYWLVDLHESYLAPTGRQAYAEFDPLHVAELVDHAVRQGWEHIVLGGESRGAALALRAARAWQLRNAGGTALKGLLVFHPYLIDGHTAIGDAATFHPIARQSNLPVYIFQPEYNSKYLHSDQLIGQLERGGARVFFHFLDGVRGGFHLRDAELLTAREAEARAALGRRIRAAIGMLGDAPGPAAPAPAVPPAPATGATERAAVLQRLDDVATPPLRLVGATGAAIDLADYAGDVVLVNFWATWCGPCVKEIASLMRLVEHFDGRRFRVLAVNISEDPATVATFFDDLDITPNFTLAFDADGSAARDWRVYAVPSSYLLDTGQHVRYGFRGALRWDGPDVVDTVERLLDAPLPAGRTRR